MAEPGSSAQQLSLPSNRRTFTLRSIVRRDRGKEDAGEVGKGPVGLTTLFEPEEPSIVDLVFVHGLNGGSFSTWTRNGDLSLFWPQEWLSKDDAFKDARIHTFGYNSSWSQESMLNIHDFATALLLSIQDCPAMPRASELQPSPLVLVGHSMGGLVIKRAYVMAKQRSEFNTLSDRVFSIFFLATPHRGSDMAELLTRLLTLSADRPFVRELHRNSPTIQAINEEFPRYGQDLKLVSFFETQPMNYGVGKGLIVERERAVMNMANETSTYLHANHRDVARFTSTSDPCYTSVRNALAAMIDLLRDHRNATRQKMAEEQRETLDAFLGASDAPESTLSDLRSARQEGSCEWFLLKDSFCRWRDGPCSQILWVPGKPGAGKSVLASRVIDEVRDGLAPRNCCFYFFTHSERSKCTAASFLLSMAWQMAVLHPEILHTISRAATLWKDAKMGTTDHNPVWRRIFLDRIFKVKLNKTQYWIIDGFDECRQQSELINMLIKAQEMWPLSILITSRASFESTCLFQPKVNVVSEYMGEDDSREDISQFIKSHMRLVPARDEAARDAMAQEIMNKSTGSFLWVRVVLAQLQKSHSTTAAQMALESVHPDMDELYRGILDSMSQQPHDKRLAKAILRWAACSSRLLTATELQAALEVDLDDTIPDVEKAVAATCGQLVEFDAQSRLRLQHLTAKEFLTNTAANSEFGIDKAEGHLSLALACLKCLSGPGMGRVKYRRSVSDRDTPEKSPFMDYACVALFDHVGRSGAITTDLSQPLAVFFNSPNVLSWIEYLARQSDLSRLLQAGKTLSQLLKQGNVSHIADISPDIQTLTSWSMDLVRLTSKFGRQLRSHPEAIHRLIPPFCPQESALYRRFASPRDLHLVGLSNQAWDDCSSVITYRKGETITAAACSERYFALGTMLSKEIVLYDELTCQETKRLDNQEAVMILVFGSTGRSLASAGPKSIKIFELESGEMISNIPSAHRCMSLEFIEDDTIMLIALKNNLFVYWDMVNDELSEEGRWSADPEVKETFDFRSPTMSAISTHQNLIAVSYRAQDLLVWNYDSFMLHDVYCRETGSRRDSSMTAHKQKSTILSLAFSAAPESNALLACYFDGELVLYDTSTGTVRHTVPGVNAHCLVSSPDGRTLATGDATGTIQMFDLETLKFLYRINFDAEFIGVRALAITADGYRLLDVRGKQCHIWEPMALLRQEADDSNSDALSVSTNPQEVDFEGPMNIIYITAVALVRGGEYVLCGRDDGSVSLYESSRGHHRQTLFSHGAVISFLEYDEMAGTVVCADQSSRVVCRKLTMHPRNAWGVEDVFQIQSTSAITQVLVNQGASRLLVDTRSECLLHAVDTASTEPAANIVWSDLQRCAAWSQHPTSAEQLVLVLEGRAYLFAWDTLTLCGRRETQVINEQLLADRTLGAALDTIMASAQVIRVKSLVESRYFVTTCEDRRLVMQDRMQVHLWPADGLVPGSTSGSIEPVASCAKLSTKIEHVVGVYGQRLVFLHANGWVCSIALDAVISDNTVIEHFFIPADWLSLNNHLIIKVARSGDIVFAKQSELVIIKRGLEAERASFGSQQGSTSSIGGGGSGSGLGFGRTSRQSSFASTSGLGSPPSSRHGSIAGPSGFVSSPRRTSRADRPKIDPNSRQSSGN